MRAGATRLCPEVPVSGRKEALRCFAQPLGGDNVLEEECPRLTEARKPKGSPRDDSIMSRHTPEFRQIKYGVLGTLRNSRPEPSETFFSQFTAPTLVQREAFDLLARYHRM